MDRDAKATLPITAVVPTFNRVGLLERALRSVRSQRPHGPAQLIVVDDHSTDDNAPVAEAYGAELIRHERNLGGAAAYETGLRAARHEWVALLDDDDEWLPHHLDSVWSLREGNDLVACSCIELGPGATVQSFHGPLTKGPMFLDSPTAILHPENPVPASAAMFRRQAALAVGGFREVLCEDLDMWCRLLSRGTATLSPRVTVVYHTHPDQMSGDWEAIHTSHLEVARSFAGEDWWSSGLVERREGVTAWDRFRARQRDGVAGATREFARDLAKRPSRALGVLDVLCHRAAVRRRTSRLTSSGEPSVAVLSGVDPAAVPEQDRYEADLSNSSTLQAFLRLARRPSTATVVKTRPQAALVRLAGTRPVRASTGSNDHPEPEPVVHHEA